ncbi:hypothetical protein IR083_21005 [Dysgonomonas sp. GY75]|uniref:hypothetical protein n=1 Tax=Dysgonomonas sp. GY75 TaxID=2780419 RepID=UPI00188329B2|nr:hypothetical protein [Dysgonomonas sp. GY75]MBF0651301.1 hypothetical protein [Dysgonomonas sp. GY75]
MKKALTISVLILVCLIIDYGLGFYIGRYYIKESTVTKYITGETITGSVDSSKFELVKEEKPEIQYRDTGSTKIKYVNLPADTAAIIADWELKRTYKAMVFESDTLGKLEIFPTIQYNRLTGLDYNFTPTIRNNYIIKTKVLQPFLSGSYSTLGYVGVGGGVFYHKLGVEYQYQLDCKSGGRGHMIGGKWMF